MQAAASEPQYGDTDSMMRHHQFELLSISLSIPRNPARNMAITKPELCQTAAITTV